MTKRIFAALLSAAMLISLAACGGSSEPAAPTAVPAVTEAPKPVATEIPAPAAPIEMPAEETAAIPVAVSVDELLQSEETQSIVPENYYDCINLLVDLGFVELYALNMTGDMYRPGTLTYNNDAFKLEFQYKHWTSGSFNDWIIYGTKTDCMSDISGLAFNEFDHLYEFPVWAYTDRVKHLDVCPQHFEYHLANFGEAGQAYPLKDWSLDQWDWGLYDQSTLVSDFAQYMALYSPGSRNMYNIVSTFTEPGDYAPGDFYNIFFWEPYEMVQKAWAVMEGVKFFYVDFAAEPGTSNIIFFEPGMTWKDWVDSKYNLDGWVFEDQGGTGKVIAPNNSYSVPVQYHADGSLDPLDMFLSETGEQTFITVTHLN